MRRIIDKLAEYPVIFLGGLFLLIHTIADIVFDAISDILHR